MMNKKIYQAINEKYGDVINLREEEVESVVSEFFSHCREESIDLLIANELDYNKVDDVFVTAYNNNCDNINRIEDKIIKAKNIISENQEFSSKDEEIDYLKRKLQSVNNELDDVQSQLNSLVDNHTDILDACNALFSIHSLDMYSYNTSISIIEKSYEECLNATETVGILEGYNACGSTILNRIDKLDRDLTETIRKN